MINKFWSLTVHSFLSVADHSFSRFTHQVIHLFIMFRSTFLLILATSIWKSGVNAVVTTQVDPIAIDTAAWITTSDSFVTGNEITNAYDKNTNTFWLSQPAAFPHLTYVDMMNPYVVTGFVYTPRQDGSTVGNIGLHQIQTCTTGNNWITVAQGTWINDGTVKTTMFTPTIARYVRLIISSEASNTGIQVASAAEFQVLTNPHATVQRSNWTVYVDSAQITPGGQSYGGNYAVDSGPQTMWHTQWTPNAPPLPHYFTIDQGSAISVGGINYLPRIYTTGTNGRIGQYVVQYSFDSTGWTTVAMGTWADTYSLKFAEWNPVVARWWRLIALSEAGNRGPWTSAAEINLLDGSNTLANFVITVDSQEDAAGYAAINAVDGNPTTIWHTSFSSPAPFPHYFIFDLRTPLPVKALNYLPRQDNSANGNIGQHVIDVSTDNVTWTTVATGAFPDNPDPKLVEFSETVARFVRLTSLSEAGNRGQWSSAAEITLQYDVSYVPPALNVVGQWGLTVDFPLVPVAAGLIPSTGGLVAWSSWNPNGAGSTSSPLGQTLTATYYPNGTVTHALVVNVAHDMFCPGISIDFDGKIIVTGGNDAPRTSLYNHTTNLWYKGHDMILSRGYQASATLSNGNIFTIGGSWSGGISKKNGEVYNVASDTWTMLPGADVTPMLTADAAGLYRADNHGYFFGWKNGAVFQAGPSKAMNWYTTNGNGGVQGAGTRSDSPDGMCGNAVMFDAVAGKILTFGGSTSYTSAPAFANTYIVSITDVGTQAQTTKIASMNFRRIFASAVVLPDGSVFVAGGQDYGSPFDDDSSQMYPELWSPVSQTWSIMAPMSVARNYHSTGLLLPDATVMVSGGGLCDFCEMNHYDGQIFNPPYLFNANGTKAVRPIILSISSSIVAVGGMLIVNTNNLVGNFSIVRMGTNTHTVNTDQRRIPLTPTTACSTSYTLTLPSDAGVVLPGYWMLFAMNSAGVPSLSKTIKITL
jgi:galactose oxidase